MSVNTEVPRERSYYSPTTHAGQQRKDRGIEWDWVGQTIENGGVKDGEKRNVVVFTYNIHGEGNVRVVASIANGDILTITWESETAEKNHSRFE